MCDTQCGLPPRPCRGAVATPNDLGVQTAGSAAGLGDRCGSGTERPPWGGARGLSLSPLTVPGSPGSWPPCAHALRSPPPRLCLPRPEWSDRPLRPPPPRSEEWLPSTPAPLTGAMDPCQAHAHPIGVAVGTGAPCSSGSSPCWRVGYGRRCPGRGPSAGEGAPTAGGVEPAAAPQCWPGRYLPNTRKDRKGRRS